MSTPENGPNRQRPYRGRAKASLWGTALLSSGLLAAGILLSTSDSDEVKPSVKPPKNTPTVTTEKTPPKDLSPTQRLKYDLRHAYEPGSVKLTEASLTGFKPMLSDRAYNREVVSAHIDYEVGATDKYLYVNDDLLPPHELVIDSHNQTRPGVVNWAEHPSSGDINMEVSLEPYSSPTEASRKYRLYMPAMSVDGHNGKPIASLTYAGTVDITGKDNHLTSVAVEREDGIPNVQIIYPHNAQSLDNPNGIDPSNG